MKNVFKRICFTFLAIVFFAGLKAQYITTITTDKNNVFIGTANGVFQLTDSCKTWTPLNNGMGEISISELVISGNIMYAGTLNMGLFISKDYGKNWSAANVGITPTPSDPKKYPSITNIAVEGNKVALIMMGGGIYISNDNAATWKAGNPAKEGTLAKVAILKGTIFAGIGNSDSYEPYVSADDGLTWKKINKSLEFSYIYSIAASGSTIIAGGIGGINSYSLATKKWSLINSSIKQATLIAVNGPHVLVGEPYSITASADSGKTWRSINTLDVSGDYGKIAISETVIYYLNNGVLNFTTDDGAHWTGAKRGEIVTVEKYVGTINGIAFNLVGTQNGVTLSALQYSGVIFKVENTNAYPIDVNIKVSFDCKSSSPFGGVSYQTAEVVWRISCPANAIRSYVDSPEACHLHGCKDQTEAWRIVTWTVTN